MKRFTLLLLVIMMTIGAMGCSRSAASETQKEEKQASQEEVKKIVEPEVEQTEKESINLALIDANGREVVFGELPQRVVSLYASFTDLWMEAGGTLVGTVDGSTLPKSASEIPKLGKGTPNVEDLLSYEPDFVILSAGRSAHQELADVLEQSEIQFMFIDYNNFEEMMSTYESFCRLNDREDLFDSKGQELKRKIASITDAQKDQSFTYLLLFATSKSVTTKDDNIASEIINAMGGKNIAENDAVANEESKQFSMEKILELDPDFIFVQTMGSVDKAEARLEADVINNPAWQGLTAVQEDRYLYLPKDLFLYKPNMKYPDAYEYIANLTKN